MATEKGPTPIYNVFKNFSGSNGPKCRLSPEDRYRSFEIHYISSLKKKKSTYFIMSKALFKV